MLATLTAQSPFQGPAFWSLNAFLSRQRDRFGGVALRVVLQHVFMLPGVVIHIYEQTHGKMRPRATNLTGIMALALAAGSDGAHGQTFIATPGVPSGFGLAGNAWAVSLSGAVDNARPAGNALDASTSLAFGVGDPVAGIGVQGVLNLTSFRRFGASGFATLTLHRMFQNANDGLYSIAASVTYISPWGDSLGQPLGGSVIGSYLFGVDGRLAVVTLGAASDLNAARRIQAVVGFGVQLSDTVAISGGWVGNQTVLGLGWRPEFLGGTSMNLSIRSIESDARRAIGFDVNYALNVRD